MFGHYLNHTVRGRDWKPRCNLKSSTRKHRHKPNGFIYWMVCVGPLMLAQNVDIALNVHTKRVSIFDRLMCTFRFISTLFCPINVRCVCVYIAYRTYQKLLIFPIWKHQKRTTSTHTRALVHLCDTLILTQFISNAIESVHHRLCVYYECPRWQSISIWR